jgi:uncharacterized protein Smg (DUF494 family)
LSDWREGDGARRALTLLARQLEAWLDGDELAFEGLGERLEEAGLDAQSLHEAAFALRALTGAPELEGFEGAASPGPAAQRVLSSEERAALSPEAVSLLFALRRQGSLSAEQFEQVLAALSGASLRPVDVATAREVAMRVALRPEDGTDPWAQVTDHDRSH